MVKERLKKNFYNKMSISDIKGLISQISNKIQTKDKTKKEDLTQLYIDMLCTYKRSNPHKEVYINMASVKEAYIWFSSSLGAYQDIAK